MSKRLKQKTLDKMFKAWCEKQSILYVARKCRISHTTARKYKRLQDWDGRLTNVLKAAQVKADGKLADHIAENLKLARYAKGECINEIRNGLMKGRITMTDLDKIIRLEHFLRGEADSRPEIIDRKLQNLTLAELTQLRDELEKVSKR